MSSVSSRCSDCGNQPKKDCPNRRCRTCCNSKGFVCQTHVKSTWVSSYTRTTTKYSNPKRRLPSSPPLFSGMELGSSFPAEVKTAATFRCVSVRSMEEKEQYAYQTSVRIGGHVFKGILYDNGPDDEIIPNQRHLDADAAATDHMDPNFAVAVGTSGTAASAADHEAGSQLLLPYQFPHLMD